MNAVNYDALMQKEASVSRGKRLLLHCCCAPCSSTCLERLHEDFQITALFYNPNLDGEEEYLRRKGELIRFIEETGYADMLDTEYASSDFAPVAASREHDREGGASCAACFRLRLEKTARLAKELGYDYFATTLTLSPLKNSKVINEIGFSIQEELGVKYLPSDFKKRDGYLRSLRLSAEYGLYRQNYCGCEYSKREAEQRKG